MQIDVFDVGHGACSVITAPNGKRIMIDCGYREDHPYWWPSIHFYGQSVDALILTNLDEDHVGDFSEVLKNLNVRIVCTNDTIDYSRLLNMKPDGMQKGVKSVYEYLRQPNLMNLVVDLSPMKVSLFRNIYRRFTDTNNLSLVTFVEYGHFCIIYPGDLEGDGWRALLLDPAFRALLSRVNVFMASHHGRESGFCEEVFEICRPSAFIISDKEIVHDTQEITHWYREHASGLDKIIKTPWDTPETRYVFTTRSDGCMTINVNTMGGLVLQTKSDHQLHKKQPQQRLSPLLPNVLLPQLR